MPSINLFHFTKKSNSTALPDAASATVVTFTYKNDCSTHSPILLFEWESKPDFTYAQIGSIYYFITDIVYVRQKLWQLELKEDCLGTFKEQIKNSSQFVVRSTVSVNPLIIDSERVALTKPERIQSTASMRFSSNGLFVLGVVSGQGTHYYTLTPSAFKTLCSSMFLQSQPTLWETIADATANMARNFLNVWDYITSCYWIPYEFFTDGVVEKIPFGYWTSAVNGQRFEPSKTANIPTLSFDITKQGSGNTEYLNSAAFTKRTIFIPGCGTYEIDNDKIGTILAASLTCDLFGKITGTIVTDNSHVLAYVNGNVGVPVQLTDSGLPADALFSAAGGAANAAIGIATGDVFGAVSGVISSLQSVIPTPSSQGGQGSTGIKNAFPDAILTTEFYKISDAVISDGYPCMKKIKLNVSGYYRCSGTKIDFCDYYENQEITSMMEGGFYVE